MAKAIKVQNAAGDTFDVSEENLSKAVAEGFKPVGESKSITVKNEAGDTFDVSESNLQKALDEGYSPVTKERPWYAWSPETQLQALKDMAPSLTAAIAMGSGAGLPVTLATTALAGITKNAGKSPLETYLYGPVKGLEEGLTQEVFPAGAELAGKGIAAAGRGTGKLLKYGTSKLSGIPTSIMDTYLENAPAIKELGEKFGKNAYELINPIRKNIGNAVDLFKEKQSSAISKALEEAAQTKNVPDTNMQPAISYLEKALGEISPNSRAELYGMVQREIDLAKAISQEGKAPAFEAFNLQKRLQGLTTYGKNGEIISKSDDFANITKKAASKIKDSVNEAAPQIAKANNNYSKLHEVQDVLKPSMLGEGQNEASLLAAGAGKKTNVKEALTELDKILDSNFTKDVEMAAAANKFVKPDILPENRISYLALLSPHTYPLIAAGSPMGIRAGLDLARVGKYVAEKALPELGGVNAMPGMLPMATGSLGSYLYNQKRNGENQ